MKKFVSIILLTCLIIACNKREVQLAETDYSEITEPTDISPIYIFYNEEDGSAEFNRNNMIGTTNWLVNIDKRLTLEQILPHLQYLWKKRHGDGFHKNSVARNYFTCSNPDIQNLAFIDFTEVRYTEVAIADYLAERGTLDSIPECYVSINALDDISIGKNFMIKKTEVDKFLVDLYELTARDSTYNRVYMNFKSSMSFDDYIKMKSVLLKADSSRVEISNAEFIFK